MAASPRLNASERLVLVLLLCLVAGAAAWRWYRIHRAGQESLPDEAKARFGDSGDISPFCRLDGQPSHG